jgi:hypothetical protein
VTPTLEQRLERIEALLADLIGREQVRDWYSVEEFARLVGRSAFTCREWCRLGRVVARKKTSGRGAHPAWAISHAELQRFQREGLLPRQVTTSRHGLCRAMVDNASNHHEKREPT